MLIVIIATSVGGMLGSSLANMRISGKLISSVFNPTVIETAGTVAGFLFGVFAGNAFTEKATNELVDNKKEDETSYWSSVGASSGIDVIKKIFELIFS